MTAVITGYGLFLPGFRAPKPLFDALYRGQSLLKSASLAQDKRSVTTICSQLEQEDITFLDKHSKASKPLHITTKMALYASQQALNAAQLNDISTIKSGLFCSCNKAMPKINLLTDLRPNETLFNQKRRLEIQQELSTINPAKAAQYLSQILGINGPTLSFGDACTAGATALLSAQRRITKGELDVALCGATEQATHPLMQLAFCKLGALSTSPNTEPTRACRPFDMDRSGCLLADASAFIVLESEAHAKKRQAPILAYLSGGHRQSEAFKITSTDASGSLYQEVMQKALNKAQLHTHDIQHINAHGTSTPANDAAESRAIEQLFMHNSQHQFSVTSTKSALGHSLGASGMVEAILSIESLQQQKVLPTLNFTQPKHDEPLLPILKEGSAQELTHIMSNSFGFAGENACLIFSKGKV